MSAVGWRHLGAGVAIVATTAAVIWMVTFAVVTFVDSGRDGRSSGSVAQVNSCITQTRFLVLVRHGSGNRVIETINDRVRGSVVGEVASGRWPTLGGAPAANGRYVMSTATPLGRDATAIEECWDRVFPMFPGA